MAEKIRSGTLMDLVVPIHGNLPMNEIFFEFLCKNTHHPFSLIIVDNCSQDDSALFFEEMRSRGHAIQVIRNPHNQCYPVSINQGARAGRSPFIGFLNNDIIVGPEWDKPLVAALEKGYSVVSPTGLEHFPVKSRGDALYHRWRLINRKTWSVDSRENIRLKIEKMYWDFDRFTKIVRKQHHASEVRGIMGHCHLLSRALFDQIGGLDPRIQGADWDLYLTVANLKKYGKLPFDPIIFGSSFVHHFIRSTEANAKKLPVVCTHESHMRVEEKWTREEICDLWPFDEEKPGYRKSFSSSIRERILKWKIRLYAWKKNPIHILEGETQVSSQ